MKPPGSLWTRSCGQPATAPTHIPRNAVSHRLSVWTSRGVRVSNARSARRPRSCCQQWGYILGLLLVFSPSVQGALLPPSNTTVSLVGPLYFRLMWRPAGGTEPAGGYRIVVIDLENELFSHSKDILPNLTQFDLDNSAAMTFASKAQYFGATEVPALVLKNGHTYSIRIASFDDLGDASSAAQFYPNKMKALGLSKPPYRVRLCDHNYDDPTIGCNLARNPLTLILVWKKPADTGANDPHTVAILAYEVEVANDQSFATATRYEITEDALDNLYTGEGVARLVLAGLVKGQMYFARVRVRNFLGLSEWNTTSADDPRMVLSAPSAPNLQFVGSGGKQRLSMLAAEDAYRPFLSILFNASGDLGAGDGQMVTFSDIKKLDYVFQVSVSAAFEPLATWTIEQTEDTILVDNQSTKRVLIEANSSITLQFGTEYHVRMRTETIKGPSQWSSTLSRVLVKPPGPTATVNLTVSGPFALKLSWASPKDQGIGAGLNYPLIGYQIVVQVADGQPDLSSPHTLTFTQAGTQLLIQPVQKGVRYFAHVRARNTAMRWPDDTDHGFGPWSPAVGQCKDGNSRPSICGQLGIIVIDVPSVLQSFYLNPVGGNMLLGTWMASLDSGNGSSAYPILQHEIEFAEDSAFEQNVQTFFSHRNVLEFQASFSTGDIKFARVRAVNDAGTSKWSNISSATVLLLPGVPENILTSNKNMSITLAYASPTQTGLGLGKAWPLIAYEILMTAENCSQDTSETRLLIPNISWHNITLTATPLIVTSEFPAVRLTKGCTYSFRMRSQNLAGWSNWSKSVFETLLSLSSPPTDLEVYPGSALELVLNWGVPDDSGDGIVKNDALILGYRILISDDYSMEGNVRRITTINDTSLKVGSLPRKLLYCKVAAYTRAGIGKSASGQALPLIPLLLASTINLSSPITGASVMASMNFTSLSGIMPNNRISVTFPAGFNVSEAKLLPGFNAWELESEVIGCGTDCIPNAEMVSIIYRAKTSLPAAAPMTISLHGIKNRQWSGPTQPFEIRHLDTVGGTIEEDLNVAPIVLNPGSLGGLSVSLSDARTGSQNDLVLEVSSSIRNPLPPNLTFVLELPAKISIQHLTSCWMSAAEVHTSTDMVRTNCSIRLKFIQSTLLEEGLSVMDVHGQKIFLRRVGGVEITMDSTVQIVISHIRNDAVVGWSGKFSLNVLTESGYEIDGIEQEGVRFLPGNLTNASVELSIPVAYTWTSATVCFQSGFVGIPDNTMISIVFPGSHILTEMFLQKDVATVNGTLFLTVVDNVANISVSGGSLPWSHACLVFRRIRNLHAGPTAFYHIITSSLSRNGVMEQNLVVPSNLLVPANLQVNRFEASSVHTGEQIDLTLEITLYGSFNFGGTAGGRIIIELPAGFETVGVPVLKIFEVKSSVFLGAWTMNVSGTNATMFQVMGYNLPDLECQANGWLMCGSGVILDMMGEVEWPSGTSIYFMLSGIRNRPFDGPPANFRIFTTDLRNHLSDLNTTMQMILSPNRMPSLEVRPESILPNSNDAIAITFLCSNPLPPECDFLMTIPVGYAITTRTVNHQVIRRIEVSSNENTLDGILTLQYDEHSRAADGLNLTLQRRRGEKIMRGSNITFTLSGLTSRSTSGWTGNFSMIIQTLSGHVLEQNLTILGPYLKYAAPHLLRVTPSNAPCSQTKNITLNGANFGPVQTNSFLQGASEQRSVSLGSSTCLWTIWSSDSSLTCSTPDGGLSLQAIVTIERQIASLSHVFTYDSMIVTQISPSNAVLSKVLHLQGLNFRSFDSSGSIRTGFTSCQQSGWKSDTTLLCLVANTKGYTRSVQITLGNKAHSVLSSVSFDFPGISSSTIANARSPTIVETFTSRFSHNLTFSMRFGSTNCEASFWESDTVVTCKTSRMFGRSAKVLLTSGVGVASFSEAFSTDQAMLLKPVWKAGQATVLSWTNMTGVGELAYSLQVRIGASDAEKTEWISQSTVLCTLPLRVGPSMTVAVSTGQNVQSVTESVSYYHPFASNLSPANSASGRISVIVHGKISEQSKSAAGKISASSCESSVWLSDSALMCMSSVRTSGSRGCRITVGMDLGSLSQSLSFDSAIVSKIQSTLNRNLVISGLLKVSNVDASLALRIGSTGADATSWISDTALFVMKGLSVAGSVSICITSGVQMGSASRVLSYAVPSFLQLSPSNSDPGNRNLVIFYAKTANLALRSPSIRIGKSDCESSQWTSETTLLCKISKRTLRTLGYVMTSGLAPGSTTKSLSYDLMMPRADAQTNVFKASLVTIKGLSFSFGSVSSRIGASSCESTEWTSVTSLACKLGLHYSRSRSMVVTSTSLTSSCSKILSFDLLKFSSALWVQGGQGTNASLSSLFAILRYSSQLRVGDSVAEITTWLSETTLRCRRVLAIQGSLRVVVTVGNGPSGGTLTEALSHEGVKISSLSATLRISSGQSTWVATHAQSFGPADYSGKISHGTVCEVSTWLSDSAVRCRSVQSQLSSSPVTLTSGVQVGTLSQASSFDSFSVSSSSMRNHPDYLAVITINGLNLGLWDQSSRASIGMTTVQASVWVSTCSMLCKAASGSRSTQSLSISSQILVRSSSHLFSYDKFDVSSMNVKNLPTRAGSPARFSGLNLKPSDLSISGRISRTAFEFTSWISSTSLTCFIPVGVREWTGMTAILSVDQNTGSYTEVYTYDGLRIDETMTTRCNIPMQRMRTFELSIFGQNLGLSDFSARAAAGFTACVVSLWYSDSSLSCRTAGGIHSKSTHVLSTTVNGLTASMMKELTFDAPSTSGHSMANLKQNSAIFTVFGLLSSAVSYSSGINVGSSAVEATLWLSETSCLSKVLRGWFSTFRVGVTSGLSLGTDTEVMSYDAPVPLPHESNHITGIIGFSKIRGVYFSTRSVSHTANLGQTRCEASVWLSETSVVCKLVPLVGASFTLSVTAGMRSGTTSAACSFDRALLSSQTRNLASRSYVALTGVASATNMISAKPFSSLSSSARAENSACESTLWVSYTVVRCHISSSHGGTKGMVLTMGQQVVSISQAWSSDSIFVNTVSCPGGFEEVDSGPGLSHGGLRSVHGSRCKVNVVAFNMPTERSAAVHVFQYDGFRVQSMYVRIGQTACERTEWQSSTSANALLSKGSGRYSVLVLSAGEQKGTSSTSHSWDSVTVRSMMSQNAYRTSFSFTVIATSLGASDYSSQGRLGCTAFELTAWRSTSSLTCMLAWGSRRTLHVTITMNTAMTTRTQSYSIDSIAVTKALPCNMPGGLSSGALISTISGTNLGGKAVSVNVQLGQTRCEATAWKLDTSVLCLKWRLDSSQGTKSAIVTAGVFVGSLSMAFSSDLYVVSSVRSLNSAIKGTTSTTEEPHATGLFRGVAGSESRFVSIAARSGPTQCESTVWTSQTSVFCRIRSAWFASHHVSLTTGHGISSISESQTFDVALPMTMVSQNLVARQLLSVLLIDQVLAKSSDYSQVIRSSSTSCMSSAWLSSSNVLCRSAAGIGRSQHISLTAGSRVGSATSVSTFDIPVLSGIQTADVHLHNLKIQGGNFGYVDMTPSVRVRGTGCMKTVWSSDTSITCSLPDQASRDRSVRVSASQSVSTLTDTGIYDTVVHLSSVRPYNTPKISSPPAVLHGSNFGLSSLTTRARTGSTASEFTEWISDTSMKVAYCSSGVPMSQIIVTVFSCHFSFSDYTSYDEPFISTSSRMNLPGIGNLGLTLLGSNFGLYSTTCNSRLGGTAAQATTWISDTSISCSSARGGSHGAFEMPQTAVTVCGHVSSCSEVFSFDHASLVRIAVNVPLKPSDLMVQGSYFGKFSSSPGLRLGITSCSASLWFSETSVSCKHVRGFGATHVLSVTNHNNLGIVSLTEAVSFDLLTFKVTSPRWNFPVKLSADFGMMIPFRAFDALIGMSSSPMLRVGGTSCISSVWISETALLCKVFAAAPGFRLPSILSVAQQTTSVTHVLSLDVHQLFGFKCGGNVPTYQQDLLTILGDNFGVVQRSAQARVGDSGCSESNWFSDTSLACKASSGFPGLQASISITASKLTSTLSNSLSYDSPVYTAVDVDHVLADRNAVFLHGSNIGIFDYSLTVHIQPYGCKNTEWISDTSLICSLNPGFEGSDVTVQALKTSTSCLTCPRHLTLVRCKPGSTGKCIECTPCSSGFYRDCFSGHVSSGDCLPCPNKDMPHDQRYFKSEVGLNTTRCMQCKVCIQNKEYQSKRCNITSDTTCTACEPCKSGVRVGCGGESAGRCEILGSGGPKVLESAAKSLKGSRVSNSRFVTTEVFELLVKNGMGLRIPERTIVDFPDSIQDISVAIMLPTDTMLSALSDPNLLIERNLLKYGDNGTRTIFKKVSPAMYLSPTGLALSKPATLIFKLDEAENVTTPGNTVDLSIAVAMYRWDKVDQTWVKRSDVTYLMNNASDEKSGDDSLIYHTRNFSSYVILAPFREVFEIDDWWLVKSLGWSREEWTFFIFVPAGVLFCCCARLSVLYCSQRAKRMDDPSHFEQDETSESTFSRLCNTFSLYGSDPKLQDFSIVPHKNNSKDVSRKVVKRDIPLKDHDQSDFESFGVQEYADEHIPNEGDGCATVSARNEGIFEDQVFLSPVRKLQFFPDKSKEVSMQNVTLSRKLLTSGRNGGSNTTFAGVGIQLGVDMDDGFFIAEVFHDGPAAHSGEISIGDRLVAVDGVVTKEKSKREVEELIQGEDGSLVTFTLKRDDHKDPWTIISPHHIDVAMSPTEIQPEPLRKPVVLPQLQRVYSSLQKSKQESVLARPLMHPGNDKTVRRRADLETLEFSGESIRSPTCRIEIPSLLASAKVGGKQATAGPLQQQESQIADVDGALTLLHSSIKNIQERRKRASEEKTQNHILQVRDDMTRSLREGQTSLERMQALRKDMALSLKIHRDSPKVEPSSSRAKTKMPTLHFSRRSQPGILPDVEVPTDVFMTPSGRAIGAGASAAATHTVSFDQQAAARSLSETEREIARREVGGGFIHSRTGEKFEGWASDWVEKEDILKRL